MRARLLLWWSEKVKRKAFVLLACHWGMSSHLWYWPCLWTGGHPPKVEADVIESIKSLDGDFNFEVYMSLSCHNCPDVVQALSLMAIFNPKVKTVVIEGGAFQQEVTEREIMAVPMVFLNGKVFGSGRMLVEEIVAKIDTGSADREAAKLNAKENFDLLIVGGGPAGAAAAVYAARKGIRVGVAAERFWRSGERHLGH
jgi:NADH-dependent peroxiredoxin subunit F